MALRWAGGGLLAAAALCATASAASDMILLNKAERLALERAGQDPRLLAELGAPLRAGPWWNSSVTVHPGGHLATVVFPLQGSLRTSDVTVRVVRRGGLAFTELYNIVGPAAWEPLVMDALVGRSGLPGSSVSLLEAAPPAAGGRQQHPQQPPPHHPSRRSPPPP